MTDRFTPNSLRAALGDRPFRFFDQAASTQDIAQEWALANPDLPAGKPGDQLAVVVAEEQTAGRGRQGRTWYSPPSSCILCSVILKPDLAPEDVTRATMVGAVGVAEALYPYLHETVTLKWPNDVLIRGKKAAGILTEAAWLGDELGAVVVGIGINIRVDFSDADLIHPATSVEPEAGRAIDRHDLLAELLARLDYWAGQIASPLLLEAWRQRLGTLGKRVTVYTEPDRYPSPSFDGLAEAVDEHGALLVRLDDGEQRRVLAADVGLAEN